MQFFQRDGWTRMDTEELRIQKSAFLTGKKESGGREGLLRDLMFENKERNLPSESSKRKEHGAETQTRKKARDRKKTKLGI